MLSLLLPLLLVIANVFGAGMIVPQVVRLHRLRSVQGVSASWIGIGLAMNTWWIAYGLHFELWGVLPVSAVALALYGVMAAQFLRLTGREALPSIVLGMVGLGAVPFPFLLGSGWEAAGLAIGLCYGIQFSPAVIEALRSVEVEGISPVTWLMALGEAAIWLVYGMVVSDLALVSGGIGGVVMSSIILLRLAAGSRRGRSRVGRQIAFG